MARLLAIEKRRLHSSAARENAMVGVEARPEATRREAVARMDARRTEHCCSAGLVMVRVPRMLPVVNHQATHRQYIKYGDASIRGAGSAGRSLKLACRYWSEDMYVIARV